MNFGDQPKGKLDCLFCHEILNSCTFLKTLNIEKMSPGPFVSEKLTFLYIFDRSLKIFNFFNVGNPFTHEKNLNMLKNTLSKCIFDTYLLFFQMS